MTGTERIADIHCRQCGAPARFDIVRQTYLCGHCGGKTGIGEAIAQKQSFRRMQSERLKRSVSRFRLFTATCEGCGAEVVFEKDEALANCAFCGRSLVRKEYLNTEGLPESVIPFAVTREEAAECLLRWCRENGAKPEARKLKSLVPELKGFYLPYEMIRGPVHMDASRMDGNSVYHCEGFLDGAFVNRSGQLDNLLLDGMEPFDTDGMEPFDLAYIAGHRVRISDIGDEALRERIAREAEAVYTPAVGKTLETKAVNIRADAGDAVRLPVLLPVYYIAEGKLMAAVNGQTGKVSVRAEKESHYYFLPWWLKAIAATVAFSGVLFAAFRLFGMELPAALYITGLTAFFFLTVTLCLFSDTVKNRFSVEKGRAVYTSGEKTFRRERGGLVRNERLLERQAFKPVFFSRVDGTITPVELRFTTPVRILKMIGLCAAVLFLPVILALFFNGFQVSRINLGGSAVWFCIFVPVVPIYLLKFGMVELHDNPWVYCRDAKGRKKRVRNSGKKKSPKDIRELLKNILLVLFVPPISLAVWFGILCFGVMVYLTAGFG